MAELTESPAHMESSTVADVSAKMAQLATDPEASKAEREERRRQYSNYAAAKFARAIEMGKVGPKLRLHNFESDASPVAPSDKVGCRIY